MSAMEQFDFRYISPRSQQPEGEHANRDDRGPLNAEVGRGTRQDQAAENDFSSELKRYREEGRRLFDVINGGADVQTYKKLHWQGNFQEYVGLIKEHPEITRNAWQRMYDMIISYGVTQSPEGVPHYKIFDDPFRNGKQAVFGLDEPLHELVNIIHAGAKGYGPESRIILLHGPVGTAKSTIAALLKQGLEQYSRTDAGALYTIGFRIHPGHPEYTGSPGQVRWCPINEEPLQIIPDEKRAALASRLEEVSPPHSFKINIERDLCPCCRQEFREQLERAGGDLNAVLENVQVKRVLLSEKDRVGIGTFQPKDPKNQDATELSGDLNYRKLPKYGSDSDPRAFNFDGEFNVANRGMLEFVEVLKLETAFLYDLLGATQEHKIKPKKFAQTDIDEVIIAHTNEPEFKKLVADPTMEALRDRTIKVDIPYNLKLSNELRIYEKTCKNATEYIAPHTLEVAAMWAVLTRLEEPSNKSLTIIQKMKLYDGKEVTGFTAGDVRDLRNEAKREGMHGLSPRYIQDTLSVARTAAGERGITPLALLQRLDQGLSNYALIDNEKDRKRYKDLISTARREYEEVIKQEVQIAATSDPAELSALCSNYVDNVKAWVENQRSQRPHARLPDEGLMRSVEEKLEISGPQREDFRRELINSVELLELRGQRFEYTTKDRLHRALVQKLFEDKKDIIKLMERPGTTLDPAVQQNMDMIKSHLINQFGYNSQSAAEVLRLVTNIYARGDTKTR